MYCCSLLDILKRNKQFHGLRKIGNLKRKNRCVLSFSELSITLNQSGRRMVLFRLATLSIPLLRNLDTGANTFYDRAH